MRFVLTATCFSALLFCIIDEAIENCFAEFPNVTVFDFRPWCAIDDNIADSRLDKLYIYIIIKLKKNLFEHDIFIILKYINIY